MISHPGPGCHSQNKEKDHIICSIGIIALKLRCHQISWNCSKARQHKGFKSFILRVAKHIPEASPGSYPQPDKSGKPDYACMNCHIQKVIVGVTEYLRRSLKVLFVKPHEIAEPYPGNGVIQKNPQRGSPDYQTLKRGALMAYLSKSHKDQWVDQEDDHKIAHHQRQLKPPLFHRTQIKKGGKGYYLRDKRCPGIGEKIARDAKQRSGIIKCPLALIVLKSAQAEAHYADKQSIERVCDRYAEVSQNPVLSSIKNLLQHPLVIEVLAGIVLKNRIYGDYHRNSYEYVQKLPHKSHVVKIIDQKKQKKKQPLIFERAQAPQKILGKDN